MLDGKKGILRLTFQARKKEERRRIGRSLRKKEGEVEVSSHSLFELFDECQPIKITW